MSNESERRSDIGSVRIDPNAEPSRVPGSPVSGQQENAFFAEARNRHEIALLKHNLGFFGKLFGSSAAAPTNIAGFLIICSFAFIAASSYAPTTPALEDSRKWALGVVTLVVGYLFGAGSKNN